MTRGVRIAVPSAMLLAASATLTAQTPPPPFPADSGLAPARDGSSGLQTLLVLRLSKSSRRALTSRPPANPVSAPVAPTTRWHGATIDSGISAVRRADGARGARDARSVARSARRNASLRTEWSSARSIPCVETPCRTGRASSRSAAARPRSTPRAGARPRRAPDARSSSASMFSRTRPGRSFSHRIAASPSSVATSVSRADGRLHLACNTMSRFVVSMIRCHRCLLCYV